MSDFQLAPPLPPPGPPFIPASFPQNTDDGDTDGYVLNHVALQISSPAASFAFYVDFLGMSLIFALNAGPMTAYYLGYPDKGNDTVPADMARASGGRSGLLELIVAHNEHGQAEHAETNGFEKPRRKAGFAHLGLRVPDVAATLRRAEEKGWKVAKPLDKVDVHFMPLPGWERQPESTVRKWEGGFEKTFAQIAFIQDPDG
ncbi:hypothetical protein PV08_09969 [Exophiala spinifera]|uniref:VOC domain-containing protein n=1 Tax=Exophiala spinifera TaxID=91928 RepID=A0A0D1YCN0_9EURO|nr:uncharacterized protein PV08_09969 [Exophiala spinifera]KIW12691.1 hypothetical protein PV08_09969 [Exophiala spinifera]